MTEPKLPAPFIVSEPAFREWAATALKGESLQYALAVFLPRGNPTKGLTLDLAERGLINLVQRARPIEGTGHRQFQYIAVRTGKAWPMPVRRQVAR